MRTASVGLIVALAVLAGGAHAQAASHYEYGVLVPGDGPPLADTGAATDIPSRTVITFDDRPAPCDFANTTRLTNTYSSLGVVVQGPGNDDGAAVLNMCGNFLVSNFSPPNFLALNCDARLSDGGRPIGPETLLFDPPARKVAALVGSDEGGSATMNAYNAANELVDSDMVSLTSILGPISVSGVGITRVVVIFSPCIAVLDNLSFDSGTASAPLLSQTALGTFALLLLAVGVRQLQRRQSR